jgi:hypothetical protein
VAEEKSSQPAKEAPKTVPVARLMAESDAYLGYPDHVVAGALSGVNKKDMSIDEAKSLVNKWLQKPVATAEEA